MHAYTNRTIGASSGWLLVGLTLLPFLASSVEASSEAPADERLAALLAKHDVRTLIYVGSLPAPACDGREKQEIER